MKGAREGAKKKVAVNLAGSTCILDGMGSFWTAWIIHDIRVGSRSAMTGVNGITADAFAASNVDSFIDLDVVRQSTDLTLEVEYIGNRPGGAVFNAAMICMTEDGLGSREVLPLAGGPCLSGERMRISTRPLRVSVRPDRLIVNRATESHLFMRLAGKVYDFTGGPRDNSPVAIDIIDDDYASTLVRDGIVVGLVEPRVLTFYTHPANTGWDITLWATDERTGRVVFEAGEHTSMRPVIESTTTDDDQWNPTAEYLKHDRILRLDLDGFEPGWMESIETSGYLPQADVPIVGPTHAETKRARRLDASKGWK